MVVCISFSGMTPDLCFHLCHFLTPVNIYSPLFFVSSCVKVTFQSCVTLFYMAAFPCSDSTYLSSCFSSTDPVCLFGPWIMDLPQFAQSACPPILLWTVYVLLPHSSTVLKCWMSVWRFTCSLHVCMDVLKVLWFSPTSKKHSRRGVVTMLSCS